MEAEDETPPLWRLQKLPPEQGAPLLHKIIDGMCGRAYPAHHDYHNVWDLTEWKLVLEDVSMFFKAVVGKNFSDEETLQQLNQLNSCHQEAVMKCLKSRKNEIKQALLGEIVDISCAQLQDFDWQLKLALSSDKIATLQMPLLNLHLDVKENGEVKPYSIEMSKEELQSLISSLEAANKLCLNSSSQSRCVVCEKTVFKQQELTVRKPAGGPAVKITGNSEFQHYQISLLLRGKAKDVSEGGCYSRLSRSNAELTRDEDLSAP